MTPVDHVRLNELLLQCGYDDKKREFLVAGFRDGFRIGYEGRKDIRLTSKNLPLSVGTKIELWNKVMKEVKLKRYAGPYLSDDLPFEHFIQSPIGLVPKDNGRDTRLIFHLSHPRNVDPPQSVNANTPEHLSSITYKDFTAAIKLCLKLGAACFLGKSDMKSAFRNLGIHPDDWRWLVMKAESPLDGKMYYFIDKCLPFGAAISCSHFQNFSDAVAEILKFKSGRDSINYLDDFLFGAILKLLCNQQVQAFLDICADIGFPVALEKTFWATTSITFLGLLIDTVAQKVYLPAEKISKALNMIEGNH